MAWSHYGWRHSDRCLIGYECANESLSLSNLYHNYTLCTPSDSMEMKLWGVLGGRFTKATKQMSLIQTGKHQVVRGFLGLIHGNKRENKLIFSVSERRGLKLCSLHRQQSNVPLQVSSFLQTISQRQQQQPFIQKQQPFIQSHSPEGRGRRGEKQWSIWHRWETKAKTVGCHCSCAVFPEARVTVSSSPQDFKGVFFPPPFVRILFFLDIDFWSFVAPYPLHVQVKKFTQSTFKIHAWCTCLSTCHRCQARGCGPVQIY